MSDELDRQLDDALVLFVEAPVRHGLQARILARVTDRQRPVRAWTLCGAVAMMAIVGLVFSLPSRRAAIQAPGPQPVEVTTAKSLPPLLPQPVRTAASPLRAAPRPKQIAPKRAQFPTPIPLADTERELIRMGQSQPELGAFLQRPLTPIEVAPVRIEPVDLGEN